MEHTEIIGATLSQHQQALRSLLEEFDRVCKKLNISYMLFAGTMLGAVRHQGFIPWDDDLDVIMLRRDYERFLKDAPTVLNEERFFLQKEFSEHWPLFFSKLRLNGTTRPAIRVSIWISSPWTMPQAANWAENCNFTHRKLS